MAKKMRREMQGSPPTKGTKARFSTIAGDPEEQIAALEGKVKDRGERWHP